MKKLFLGAGFLLFFAFRICAQANEGEKIFIGTVNLDLSSTKDDNSNTKNTSTNFSILPKLGFGLKNHWIVGGELGFNLVQDKNSSTVTSFYQKNTTNLFSVGFFARKYKFLFDRLGVFMQGELLFGTGTQKTETSSNPGVIVTSKSTITQYGVAFKPGVFFRLSKRFAVESTFGNLGFIHTDIKNPGASGKLKNDDFNLSLTNSLSLGFDFIL